MQTQEFGYFKVLTNKLGRQLATVYDDKDYKEPIQLRVLNSKTHHEANIILENIFKTYNRDIITYIEHKEIKFYMNLGFYVFQRNKDNVVMRKSFKVPTIKSHKNKDMEYTSWLLKAKNVRI